MFGMYASQPKNSRCITCQCLDWYTLAPSTYVCNECGQVFMYLHNEELIPNSHSASWPLTFHCVADYLAYKIYKATEDYQEYVIDGDHQAAHNSPFYLLSQTIRAYTNPRIPVNTIGSNDTQAQTQTQQGAP